MNRAAKGARNEHRSMEWLERQGYTVTRSTASKSIWDIWGYRQDGFVLCQVKTRDWPGLDERAILAESVVPSNCRKELHRWRPRMRTPDVMEI